MVTTVILALILGLLIGFWSGMQIAWSAKFKAEFMEKLTNKVSKGLMDENRAYRAALTGLLGSADEAEKFMSLHRDKEGS